ncbi:FAD-dependent monooxygenase [Pararhodobacter sp. SW119]|uniref:FAD-dependent monooxygenase n=1 Tax=Pararhodobacter sp. SW119 TaxID=2780075 RepID=UPI001ADF9005|nr:FAD-dependent monooxygenase [Pararhodobacter sp. SW119]
MNQPRPIPEPAAISAVLSGLDATVIGAGVAGLGAALALRRYGADVAVLEQSAEIAEVGAGLQISPNGARVLAALGIDPAGLGDRAEAVELRDHRGRLVTRMDLPPEPGFFLCHRADLIAGLEGAARTAGIRVQLLQRVSSVDLAERANAVMNTGARLPAGLLIGADGVRSVLRAALAGPSRPFFTGQVAWRAVFPGDPGRSVVQVFMGPGRHLVSYPLRGGALRNLVAVEERQQWAAEGWTHSDDPEALRAAFAGFGGPVPDWLSQVEHAWLWGLFRHPVARRWHDGRGRAVILGDAAHSTLPFLAQGANMALEDAWVLAAELAARPDDPAAALARFEGNRLPRCRAIVAAADRNARAYHLRAPVAPLGHALLRLAGRVAPGLALGRFAWVHGHDVTRAE